MKQTSKIIITSALVLSMAGTGAWLINQNTTHHEQTTSPAKLRQTSQQTDNGREVQSKSAIRPSLLEKSPKVSPLTAAAKQEGQAILDQRPVKQVQPSQFDFSQLALGDFTSLAGTWSDAQGWSLSFSPTGITAPVGLTISPVLANENNEYASNVSTGGSGFALVFYPAGSKIPAWHFRFTSEDPSDISRDRLVGTQTNLYDYNSTQDFIDRVYYKVSDVYEQKQSSQETSEISTESLSEASTTSQPSTTQESTEASSQTSEPDSDQTD